MDGRPCYLRQVGVVELDLIAGALQHLRQVDGAQVAAFIWQ